MAAPKGKRIGQGLVDKYNKADNKGKEAILAEFKKYAAGFKSEEEMKAAILAYKPKEAKEGEAEGASILWTVGNLILAAKRIGENQEKFDAVFLSDEMPDQSIVNFSTWLDGVAGKRAKAKLDALEKDQERIASEIAKYKKLAKG
jgi:hypothetical protein